MKSFSENPKTSAIGITAGLMISALAVFVASNPALFSDNATGKWITAVALFIVGGGLTALGVAGKDGDKGGNAPNEVIDAKIPPPPDPPKL